MKDPKPTLQLPVGKRKRIPEYNRAPFLQKTHSMITQCDEKIAKWTADGNRFVIMDIEKFEEKIIPQYFDHNQFSSFERQLHYYGFSRVQNNPIRISDFDDETKTYITFYNENFKRDTTDLLVKIQRRPRAEMGKYQRIVEKLEAKVTRINHNVDSLKTRLGQVNNLKTRLSSLEKFISGQGVDGDKPTYIVPPSATAHEIVDEGSEHYTVSHSTDDEYWIFDENIFDD